MIYETVTEIQRYNLDIKILEFLPTTSVMNCKTVCSYFTRDRSFTIFYGLCHEVTAEDYPKLKDHFKKRSYMEINFSALSGSTEINVQELLDFIISECPIDRVKEIDLSLCTQITRLPALPNIEFAEFDSEFILHIPNFSCRSCIWCKLTQIYLTGCSCIFNIGPYICMFCWNWCAKKPCF